VSDEIQNLFDGLAKIEEQALGVTQRIDAATRQYNEIDLDAIRKEIETVTGELRSERGAEERAGRGGS